MIQNEKKVSVRKISVESKSFVERVCFEWYNLVKSNVILMKTPSKVATFQASFPTTYPLCK